MSDRPNNEPIEARESQRSDSSSSESASLRLHEDAYALSERNEEDRSASDNNTLSSTERDTTSNSTEKEESRTNPLDFGLHDVEIVDGSDPNAENNTELAGQSRENQEKTRELEPEKEVDEAGEATEIKDKDLDKQIKEFEQYLGGFENIDGERGGQVGEHLRQTFNRLEGVNPQQYGKADPSTQVSEMMDSMKKVMDSDGKVDGLSVHSREDRTKIVEDMARSAADPKQNINQGSHNDCVAQSIRLAHMTTDPADAVRIGSEVATTGRATLNGAEGDDPYQVKVETSSLRLDPEAKTSTDQSAGQDGKRGAFGQMYSLALNEATNDFRAKRDDPSGNTRYQYRQGVPNESFKTGEVTERYLANGDGSFRRDGAVADGPANQPKDAAVMARLAMGETDGLFISESGAQQLSLGDIDGLSQYESPEQLQEQVAEYEERSGRPARHLVDSGSLPGASGTGSGHQMALDFNPETGEFDDDTQTWGAKGDAHADLTAEQVQFASSFGGERVAGESDNRETVATETEILVDAQASLESKQAALNSALTEDAFADLYNKPFRLR